MNKYKAIGLSVVMVRNDSIVYSDTFGYNPDYSDLNKRQPIDKNGIYIIASISKTFISTAIMQLVEKGFLKLDDDINQYLPFKVINPSFPNDVITIRMLLCHRSSLNDKHYNWTFDQLTSNDIKTKESFNDYKPGEDYKYCNLGYSLLGAIIENVTGQKFFEYIEENISKPLGIKATYDLTKVDSTKLIKALYYSFKRKEFCKDNSIYDYNYFNDKINNYKLELSAPNFSPTGGIKISSLDLAKYMIMHMNKGTYGDITVLTEESEREMRKPQMGNPRYGLSFSNFKRIIEGVKLEGMVGCAHGVHSTMLFNPNEKYGFIIICNGCTSNPSDGQDLNNEVIKILYNNFIK